ncbi:hypothetical protein ACFWOJ_03305 [Streptomyces sp. NPDC058439]|uniref:hypothetical protein n=1 Tax=Streptomyces sp. NPDC058439 TaxID=3346500 RepID=UPI0036479502
MYPISRRHLLRAAGAGALVLPLPVPAASAGEDITEPGVVLPAAPTAAADAIGRLHLFAVASDGRVRTRVQKRAGGDWYPWAAFGTRAIAP